MLRVAWLGIAAVPALWLVSSSYPYLVALQIGSGAAWAAYGMGTSTFLYDAVSPAQRTRCAAYFAATVGLAQCLGALAGGWLYENLPPIGGSSFSTR